MTKTIRVSDDYHAYLKAHNRAGETMEDTLRRLAPMPHPREFADIFGEEELDEIEAAIDEHSERDRGRREELAAAFEDAGGFIARSSNRRA